MSHERSLKGAGLFEKCQSSFETRFRIAVSRSRGKLVLGVVPSVAKSMSFALIRMTILERVRRQLPSFARLDGRGARPHTPVPTRAFPSEFSSLRNWRTTLASGDQRP